MPATCKHCLSREFAGMDQAITSMTKGLFPCTQISASPTLMLLTRRLIDILQEKSATMSLDTRSKGKFQTGFSAQEIGQFWFLHALNSSLGPLRHLFYTKRGHPEELFVELLRLGGALCTSRWIRIRGIFPSTIIWSWTFALPKLSGTSTSILTCSRPQMYFPYRSNPLPTIL